MADYFSTFKSETNLIKSYGEGNAFLIWVMGLYLDCSDLAELGDECLTDQYDDKKIDFLRLDDERQKIYKKIGDSDDPLLEKRPFSTRETLKRWKREDVNYGS